MTLEYDLKTARAEERERLLEELFQELCACQIVTLARQEDPRNDNRLGMLREEVSAVVRRVFGEDTWEKITMGGRRAAAAKSASSVDGVSNTSSGRGSEATDRKPVR